MTLYLKYRPKNLEEIDIPEVGVSLKKIVVSANVPHAFLFSGPKGTGKTSAARILAKIINCESDSKKLRGEELLNPCGECKQCVSIANGSNLDVIEIDAASHRGIDDIRVLRDALKLAPVAAKKKIYIIDEAHMLTTEASNALLKTLEEPPSHVVFILATTNPEKLIDTIISRVTNIPFRKANIAEIVNSLKRVIKGEGIKVEEEALEIIAKAGGGAFRDAIKILEQLVAEGKNLDKDTLETYLFGKTATNIEEFVTLLASKNAKLLLPETEKVVSQGISIEVFLGSVITMLRERLISQVLDGKENEFEKENLVELIEILIDAKKNISESPIEELPLELAIIKWCDEDGKTTIVKSQEENIKTETEEKKDIAPETPKKELAENVDINMQYSNLVNDDIWKKILEAIKPINASLEALLRSSRPVGYDGKTLTLGVFYKFHKERLEDSRHRMIVEDVIGKTLQSQTRVVCTLVEPPVKKVTQEAKVETVLTEGKDQDIIKVAEEIFSN